MHGSLRGEVSRKRILWHYPSFLQPYKLLRFSRSPTKWGEMDWREWRDHFSGHWAGVHSIFSMSKRKILYFPSCQFAGGSWEVKSTETWKPWGLRKSELLVQRFIVSVDESKNAWTLWITFKMKKPICSTLSLSSFSKLSKVFSLHRHGLKKDWDQTQTQNWS